MIELSIKYKSVDDLIPYVNNSRTHSDEQVTQVAASIKEFNFTNPVLIDEQGGNILAQRHVFIKPYEDTARDVWEDKLAPLGAELLIDVVKQIRDSGFLIGKKQEEKYATWEPSIDRPPSFRPDLVLLPYAG